RLDLSGDLLPHSLNKGVGQHRTRADPFVYVKGSESSKTGDVLEVFTSRKVSIREMNDLVRVIERLRRTYRLIAVGPVLSVGICLQVLVGVSNLSHGLSCQHVRPPGGIVRVL